MLDAVDVDSVPVQGTAIGTAIREAIKAFENAGRGQRVLVLLTDGEDQGTDPLGAADEAAKAGVVIYAIGIGSPEGVPIPEAGQYKKDGEGNLVQTRREADTLQRIALKTGGKYVEGKSSGELELDEVYSSVGEFEKTLQESKTYTIYEDRFPWFLLVAALLLGWEMLATDRRRVVE